LRMRIATVVQVLVEHGVPEERIVRFDGDGAGPRVGILVERACDGRRGIAHGLMPIDDCQDRAFADALYRAAERMHREDPAPETQLKQARAVRLSPAERPLTDWTAYVAEIAARTRSLCCPACGRWVQYPKCRLEQLTSCGDEVLCQPCGNWAMLIYVRFGVRPLFVYAPPTHTPWCAGCAW
jgi:hypothetical protein